MLFHHIRVFIETHGSIPVSSIITNKSVEAFSYWLYNELKAIGYPIEELFTHGRGFWRDEWHNIKDEFERYKDKSLVSVLIYIDPKTGEHRNAISTLPINFTTYNKKVGVHTDKGWIETKYVRSIVLK